MFQEKSPILLSRITQAPRRIMNLSNNDPISDMERHEGRSGNMDQDMP